MRSNGLVSMAHALAWNLNRGQRDVRLFEIGRAYRQLKMARPSRRASSRSAPRAWRAKRRCGIGARISFADLKGDLDQIGELAGGFAWNAVRLGPGRMRLAPAISPRQIRHGQSRALGAAGQLRTRVADQVQAAPGRLSGRDVARALLRRLPAGRAGGAKLSADFALSGGGARFFADPRRWHGFAAVREDHRSRWASRRLLRSRPSTSFAGKNVPPGKFSLLVRVTFQSQEATLTEAQLNEFFLAHHFRPRTASSARRCAPPKPSCGRRPALRSPLALSLSAVRTIRRRQRSDSFAGRHEHESRDLRPDLQRRRGPRARLRGGIGASTWTSVCAQIARATGAVDSVKVAVLAALSIADELQTLRQSRRARRCGRASSANVAQADRSLRFSSRAAAPSKDTPCMARIRLDGRASAPLEWTRSRPATRVIGAKIF